MNFFLVWSNVSGPRFMYPLISARGTISLVVISILPAALRLTSFLSFFLLLVLLHVEVVFLGLFSRPELELELILERFLDLIAGLVLDLVLVLVVIIVLKLILTAGWRLGGRLLVDPQADLLLDLLGGFQHQGELALRRTGSVLCLRIRLHQEPLVGFQLCLQLIQGTAGDLQKSYVILCGMSPIPFCDIARYRNSALPYL